jgi:EmrB/QacA subfamily drug resistance transporter
MRKIGNLITDENRKWWILGTVCFALFMIILDNTVVSLAIPSIIRNFNASISQVEWVTNAYLLSFAVLLITLGRLGDEFGRRRLFAIGLIMFTGSSVLCGLSGSINQLIFFRALQGIGGAAMMPATLSLITVNFDPKKRGVALGIWGSIAGLGIVFGPIVGGYLTQNGLGGSINSFLHITSYWRYVFFINLPVGLLALLATFLIIPESKDKEKKHPIDFVGVILSSLSVFFLTFGLIESTKFGWWHAEKVFSILEVKLDFGNLSIIPVFFALSVIFGILFFLGERRETKEPLINLELFKDRNYAVGNLVTAILSFAMMGSFFLLPLFLQSILGFSPSKTGVILLPLAFSMIIVAPFAGKTADKFGARYLAFFGLLIMALGQFLIAHFTVNTSVSDLILPFVVMGVGMGIIQAPISSAVLKNVPPDKAGGASGVVTTIRQIGAVMGIAVLGAFLQSFLVTNLTSDLNNVKNLPQSVKQQIISETKAGNTINSSTDAEKNLDRIVKQQVEKTIQTPDVSKLPPVMKQSVLQQVESAKNALINKFKEIGIGIVSAIKHAFADSINEAIRIASLVTVFGAFVSLLLENPKRKTKVKE